MSRVYMLNMKDGSRQKVTVPENWRLTFGPLVPGSKDGHHNGSNACVLRFYEKSKDNQRAVFTDVESFRDTTTMAVEVEVTTTKQETLTKRTDQGEKHFIVEANVKEWQDPDAPKTQNPEFARLPHSLGDESRVFTVKEER